MDIFVMFFLLVDVLYSEDFGGNFKDLIVKMRFEFVLFIWIFFMFVYFEYLKFWEEDKK